MIGKSAIHETFQTSGPVELALLEWIVVRRTTTASAGAGGQPPPSAVTAAPPSAATRMEYGEKVGRRSYIILVFDADGKCSQWYHFNSDTPKGCKCAIEQINKQLQKERNHPVAKRHLNKYLTFLEARAVRMKRSIDDTADATDTAEVTGATTDATKTTIAKPRLPKIRKVSSERPIYAVLEDWETRTRQTMICLLPDDLCTSATASNY